VTLLTAWQLFGTLRVWPDLRIIDHTRSAYKTFGFLQLDTETLMTADAIDLDDLQRKCTDFATAFPDDVDGARLVDEIQDCRILVSRRVGVDVTPLGIFKFIKIWWKWRISQLESGTADSVDSVYFCCWLRTFFLQDETHYDISQVNNDGDWRT